MRITAAAKIHVFFKLLTANVNNIIGQSLSPGPLPEMQPITEAFAASSYS